MIAKTNSDHSSRKCSYQRGPRHREMNADRYSATSPHDFNAKYLPPVIRTAVKSWDRYRISQPITHGRITETSQGNDWFIPRHKESLFISYICEVADWRTSSGGVRIGSTPYFICLTHTYLFKCGQDVCGVLVMMLRSAGSAKF